jgi:polyhydroxyalkanoate synthesis regulator phasin
MVVSEVRKYMEAAVEKLTPAKAQEMARSLMQGQAKGKEQVQKVAQDLMDWSNHTRERMADMVRREVARQLKAMGVATKDDLEALKRRVRELERGGTTKASTAKRPASKSSKARSTAAKRSSTVRAPDKGGS